MTTPDLTPEVLAELRRRIREPSSKFSTADLACYVRVHGPALLEGYERLRDELIDANAMLQLMARFAHHMPRCWERGPNASCVCGYDRAFDKLCDFQRGKEPTR